MGSFNRQACFNELSSLDKDYEEDAILLFSSYAKTIKVLKAKGFNGIRYEHGIASLYLKKTCGIYLTFRVIRNTETRSFLSFPRPEVLI